jgi:hypothetical protein
MIITTGWISGCFTNRELESLCASFHIPDENERKPTEEFSNERFLSWHSV